MNVHSNKKANGIKIVASNDLIVSALSSIVSFLRRNAFKLMSIPLLMSALAVYYAYLTRLYLIDEVYEGNMLRELTLLEKTTVIVEPPNEKGLKSFVSHYSLCKAVHEVVVFWPPSDQSGSESIPVPKSASKYFTFAHTHSLIRFWAPDQLSGAEPFNLDESSVSTNSVLFLDPDVHVSCEDIAFAISVWRSANRSLTGFFPRTHRLIGAQESIEYQGALDVWSSGSYSLMLSAGVIMSRQYLLLRHGQLAPPFDRVGGSALASLTVLLRRESPCRSVALSVYTAHLGATPPVWVDVPVSIEKARAPHDTGSGTISGSVEKIRSRCLQEALAALSASANILKYSRHKASRASTHLWW